MRRSVAVASIFAAAVMLGVAPTAFAQRGGGAVRGGGGGGFHGGGGGGFHGGGTVGGGGGMRGGATMRGGTASGGWHGGGNRGGGSGWHGGHGGDWHGGHGDWHGGHDHHHHGGHGSVFFGVSPWFWGYPYYGYYGYPYYAYPSPYSYGYPPDDYGDDDQEYAERPSDSDDRTQGYWYWCESKNGYYPNVAQCPEDWVKVPAQPER